MHPNAYCSFLSFSEHRRNSTWEFLHHATCWKLTACLCLLIVGVFSLSVLERERRRSVWNCWCIFNIFCPSSVKINGDNIQKKKKLFQANLPSISVSSNLTYHIAFHQSVLRKPAIAISCYILCYAYSSILNYLFELIFLLFIRVLIPVWPGRKTSNKGLTKQLCFYSWLLFPFLEGMSSG